MGYETVGQLALSMLLGALIGAERKFSHKTAGMRTFALVALGATLFSILSKSVGGDPGRIAAQIVVGIGFLGAGLIIFNKERVQGLTTAAGLWVAAAIGMAVGYGYYAIAFAATALTLIIFLVLWWVEEKIFSKLPSRHDNGDESDNEAMA